MLLLGLGALGFALGYRLGVAKRGFIAVGLVSIGASLLQMGHLFATTDRTQMTMLPLVVGTVVVAGMLIGGLLRSGPRSMTAA